MRTLLLPALLLAALSACDGNKPEDSGPATLTDDADGDGYAAGDGDCNDDSASIHPDATEICNGVDDDCDGATDEDAGNAYYADADGDGHGAGDATHSCSFPAGYATTGDDCDDADATVFPGAAEDCTATVDQNCDGSIGDVDADGDGFVACEDCDDGNGAANPDGVEVCDGADDDCDGLTDEDGDTTFYRDEDADGYGDPDRTLVSCDKPDGYATTADDCDDTSALVHPGAPETDCADPVDYNCDGSTSYADADGDGSPACQDCDDGNASVSPLASEVCDGIDNDCDHQTDEFGAVDAPLFYPDNDGDGYGDGSSPAVSGCSGPPGYVEDTSDCDDSDATANPAATEVCDGVDNDCDGLADELGAVGEATYYGDVDGDGYGRADVTLVACSASIGYATEGTDCDDAEPTTNPGAVELCDLVDNDCDGDVDEAGAAGESPWYLDEDGDGYGGASSVTACSAPSGYVATADDCDDTLASVSPAGTEACDGVDDDCDGAVDETGATGETAFHADADGDGYGDPDVATLACSAPAGYVADATDCDDTSADVNPAGTETCDGIDDDCDGLADESGGPAWYADADGDGYGDAAVVIEACSAPTGYVADATDCDDADPDTSPGTAESCDAVDDDCDGDIDEDGACPCTVETRDGTPYLFCDPGGEEGGYDWASARDACATYGYTLATISDADENAWVVSETVGIDGGAYWWIGFAEGSDGTYAWASGEPVTYTDWHAGEPSGGTEACAVLDRFGDDTWNDAYCYYTLPFVCEG